MQKEQLIEQLQQNRSESKFFTIPLSAVKEVSESEVALKNVTLKSTNWSRSQMLRSLGIPNPFYSDIDIKVQRQIIAAKSGEKADTFIKLKVETKTKTLLAALPVDYSEFRVENLLSKLPDWDYVGSSLDPTSPYLRYQGINREVAIEEGMHHAFVLYISELGAYKDAVIESAIYVLACTNGLYRKRQGMSYCRIPLQGLSLAVVESVGSVLVEQLLSESEALKAQIENSRSRELENPTEEVESWFSLRIPKVIPKKVLARLEIEQSPVKTYYDLAQVVSNVATEIEAFSVKSQFESFAGQLMGLTIDVPAIV